MARPYLRLLALRFRVTILEPLSTYLVAKGREVLVGVGQLDVRRARLLNDNRGLVEDLIGLGRLHGENGQLDKAKAKFDQAIETARDIGFQSGEARAAGQLGAFYLLTGDYDVASELLEFAIPKLDKKAERPMLVDSLMRLGEVNRRRGRPQSALTAWIEALEISQAASSHRQEAIALFNLAKASYDLKRYSDAENYYRRALPMLNRYRDVERIAYATFFLGVIARHFGRLSEAVRFMQESRDLFRIRKDAKHLAEAEKYLEYLAAGSQ